MPGEDLQKYSYRYLLDLALSKVPNTIDKREGSIIYDALAPACYVLADFFMEMYLYSQKTFAATATGEWLDLRVGEAGISRNLATAAIKKATFTRADGSPATVQEGNRFATISTDVPLYYVITGPYLDDNGDPVPGSYLATCESTGTAGSQYFGTIVPLDFVPNIATATLGDVVVPGTETETDESLRERYFEKINYRAFAGNIADYKEVTRAITGVGGVQVYPTWNGGGTVKLSVIDSLLAPVTEDFLQLIQNEIDPTAAGGSGLGKAPIDHAVTVVTPETFTANVAGKVTLVSGYSLPQLQEKVRAAIEEYFVTLRKSWDDGDELNQYTLAIYQAQIIRAILSVPGIANVTGVSVNGLSTDILLEESSEKQQIPVLGEVSLSESN